MMKPRIKNPRLALQRAVQFATTYGTSSEDLQKELVDTVHVDMAHVELRLMAHYVQGCKTGRTQCAVPNRSNTPKRGR